MDEQFSVAMSVYRGDNVEYFKVALESILLQTVTPNEIVIVFDGNVDIEILNIIKKKDKEYKEKVEFKVIQLSENRGLGEALKIAVKNCSYDLIARMDSDDISVKDRFEKQLKYLAAHKNISVVGGYIYEFVDDISNVVGIRKVPEENDRIKEYAKKRAPINHVTVMFRKNAVLNAGNYRKWYCNEDYYLWIRMIKNKVEFHNLGENLVFVRVGNEMYRRRGGKKYFCSECKLQQYMLKIGYISRNQYIFNIFIRWIVQILLPNNIRGYIFQKLARTKYYNNSDKKCKSRF